MITHLKVKLLDRNDDVVEACTLPTDAAIAKGAEFMKLLGTDPDEAGAAAAAGRIEFEPVRDPATISGPFSKREREIMLVMLHGMEDNLSSINSVYHEIVDDEVAAVTKEELRLIGNRLLRASGLAV